MKFNVEDGGVGKYDHLADAARIAASAQGVILIVFGGPTRMGFSVQLPPAMLVTVPTLLRELAEGIDKQINAFGGPAGYIQHLVETGQCEPLNK